MYEILRYPKILSKEDIDRTFDGKWVYIVNAKFTPNDMLVEGMPVVIADCPFDGVEDGIYEQFDGAEFGANCSYTLLKRPDYFVSAFTI